MPDPSVTAAPRAVILSYAREVAASARLIAEALHNFGVDVWIDRSELLGGGAWDQKIRQQIKDCVLFIPIVSTNTQDRGEGYFRFEWKLAADRTHLMAVGVPFLVPVAIDYAHEENALVPLEFMRVQWTRLADGIATAEFTGQVKRLLVPSYKSAAAAKTGFPLWAAVALGVVVLGLGEFIGLRPGVKAPAAPRPALQGCARESGAARLTGREQSTSNLQSRLRGT